MNLNLDIASRKISADDIPFIIAEMSGNHGKSLDKAKKLVESAANAGADAIKLQTYTPDTITLNISHGEFVIEPENQLWKGRSLYDLYEEAHTPWEWHKPIFDYARELGIICFSSPFDETAIDFLEDLNCPAYKIASFENNHLPLIKKAASTGKPLIISTGLATVDEIDEAVNVARDAGCSQLLLLKCTSSYPADPSDSNVLTVPDMRRKYDCLIGLSDHTNGIGAAIASIAHGAVVIEKHLTMKRSVYTVDSQFSLEPDEFKLLVRESKCAWESLGKIYYGPTDDEIKSLRFRRSLYIAKDMRVGDVLTSESLRVVRPSLGLHPRYYESLLGKKVNKDISKGTPVSFEIIDYSINGF